MPKKERVFELVDLRSELNRLEDGFGLTDLSRTERDVLFAFADSIIDESGLASSERARNFPVVCNISQPTFHRALKKLVEKGFIEKPDGLPHGVYRVAFVEFAPQEKRRAT